MGYKKIKGEEIDGNLANGDVVKVNTYFSIPVRFKLTTFCLVRFYIIENAPNKFVLGSDFCTDTNLVMTYKDKQWSYDVNLENKIENGINEYSNLDGEQKLKLSKVVSKFQTLCTGKLGRTHLYEHKIDTGDAEPVFKG